jgi:hypothetical protein
MVKTKPKRVMEEVRQRVTAGSSRAQPSFGREHTAPPSVPHRVEATGRRQSMSVLPPRSPSPPPPAASVPITNNKNKFLSEEISWALKTYAHKLRRNPNTKFTELAKDLARKVIKVI